jgi:hypothetical protein
MNGTSVTVVLIGATTSESKWVKYEIENSVHRGNGLLGVYVHNQKDSSGYTSARGSNPFDNVSVVTPYGNRRLSESVPTYDWVTDDGYSRLGEWIEAAAKKAGR